MLNKRPSYFIQNESSTSKYIIDANIPELIKKSRQPKEWLEHLRHDLLRFWDTDEAMIMEHHLFPTFRGSDGSILKPDASNLPQDFIETMKHSDTKDFIHPEYNYVKMHSAQTYGYGIAYHLTGKEKYLELCKKGAYALIEHAKDGIHGLFTMQNRISGTWGPEPNKRTLPELSYGLLGLGMYFYLTHDSAAMYTLLECKEYIFSTYLNSGQHYFTCYPAYENSKKTSVVVQLCQISTYMLLITPSLPEPYQTQWKKDLHMIASILVKHFYSQRYGFSWENSSLDSSTDFGHSAKVYRILYEIGFYLNEFSLIHFARQNMDQLLEDAYVSPEDGIPGNWGRRYNKDGSFLNDKIWWQYAELNQICGILTLNDPSYLGYLNETCLYWFQYMVDHEYGEIFHFVDGTTNTPVPYYPKIHQWKSCRHSFEHCLFGYLISSQIKDMDFSLYYALKSKEEALSDRIRPYLFEADKKSVHMEYFHQIDDDTNKIKIVYHSLF